jgi:tRNA-dihydrouridine synthase B
METQTPSTPPFSPPIQHSTTPLLHHSAPLRLGPLELPSRFFLAPLAGYTNLPFRLVARPLGGLGLATTDLVNARSLIEKRRQAMELIETSSDDQPLAVQIFGTVKEELCAAAQLLASLGVSVVDLNMGCPVHKVVRGGGGSAMMRETHKTVALVRALVESVKIPVTVKMRLGWDDANISAPFFAREFEQAGVAAVTIHGRTRAQGFSGSVNRPGIRAVVEAVERIPIVGNGDIRTVEDARTMFAETGCAAVGIGRGALLNPWIFRQCVAALVRGEPVVTPTCAERINYMIAHYEMLQRFRGERVACIQFRKMSRWYGRSLRIPKAMQHRLVMLKDAAGFYGLVADVRALPPRPEPPPAHGEPAIPVSFKPNEHW